MGFSKFSKKECRSSFEIRVIKMPDQPIDDAMPTGHNINGASKFSNPKKPRHVLLQVLQVFSETIVIGVLMLEILKLLVVRPFHNEYGNEICAKRLFIKRSYEYLLLQKKNIDR